MEHQYLLAHLLISICLVCVCESAVSSDSATNQNNDNNEALQVKWGLPDAVAYVGKLFMYTIPPDAFQGTVYYYKVHQITEEPLPVWVVFDQYRKQLYGVPSGLDQGSLNILVSAIGNRVNSTHSQVIDDAFTIHVRLEAPLSGHSAKLTLASDKNDKSIECSVGESQLNLLLLLDVQYERMYAIERVSVLERAARDFGVHTNVLRLYTPEYVNAQTRTSRLLLGVVDWLGWLYTPEYVNAQTRTSSLMVGAGNQRTPRHSGTYLSWTLACGDKIQKAQIPRIEDVERRARSGELARALRYPVVSWQVRAIELQARQRRRQFGYMTPTPVPQRTTLSPTPSTRESSRTTEAVKITTKRQQPTPTTTRPKQTTTLYTTSETSLPQATTQKTAPRTADDKRPEVKSLGTMQCVRGELCKLLIPRDTFTDDNDGDAYSLDLSLTALSTSGEQDGDWLVLKGRHLIGFCMKGGDYEFRLSATDSAGLMASTAFVVSVIESSESEQSTHHVNVHLQMDYDTFIGDNRMQLKVLKALAKAMGDRDPTLVTIDSFSAGSVIVQWSNNSFPNDGCYERFLDAFVSKLLSNDQRVVSDDGNSISGPAASTFGRRMRSAVAKVTHVQFVRQGACLKVPSTTTASTKTAQEDQTKSQVNESVADSELINTELLYSTVIPAVVIIVLLLLALILVCCLYKRNRRYKLNSELEAKSVYVSKGLPVMFPEEVDSETDPLNAAASPCLVKEERPPLQVPLLDATDTSPAHATPPPMPLHRQAGSRHEMEPLMGRQPISEHENPLYKAPPPIELSQTRSPRPQHKQMLMPGHRQPPPYVPP